MIEELKEIREELLLGVENEDLLYIKMQINNLDTLIYNLSQEKERGFTTSSIQDRMKGKGTIVMVGAGSGMMNQEFIKKLSEIPNIELISLDEGSYPIEDYDQRLLLSKNQFGDIKRLEVQPLLECTTTDGKPKTLKPGSKEFRKQANNFNKNSHRKKRKR